ncbi:ankyrin repeat domain-containing protein [Microbacterium sp. NEAU-LLC]|uniref:Ankyrin repeat domain-containing protein n=1 Tax=Microbacterium helvum TaxID=2773713 RepID=A0ABR8NI02_9MICO|nr:ankyrin repeat domain-containing protein [Microbacterium helvum]MBD3940325.1 ankyrin repeat domain-containing protein [Microbacterium helvum]
MRRSPLLLAIAAGLTVALAACTAQNPDAGGPAPSGGASSPAPEPELAPLDDDLIDAAWANDVPRAAELIAAGADVDAQDRTQQSAYLIATSEGYLDLLRLTLDHGASIDDKDSWNGTGLIRAAERGHGYVVGALLQAGIDRDHVNRIGYQAIHESIWLGDDTLEYHTTVRALVAGGVELDRPSGSEGLTPLQMAGEREFPTAVQTLTTALSSAAPADPDEALLAAAQSGDADAAALALRAGADLEVRDAELQRTPLMHAVMEDHVSVAQLLVAMGADPDAFDYRQDTPWVMTGVTGSVAMLEALLPGQPDLSIPNRRGGTPAHPAAERGHVEYIRRVVQVPGVDLDRVNLNGWTALLEAVVFGDGGADQQEIVRLLLAAGADPGIRDAAGLTAREEAERRGFPELATLLPD